MGDTKKSNCQKGWPQDSGSFYEYLRDIWDVHFCYKDHEYGIDRCPKHGISQGGPDGYVITDLEDRDEYGWAKILHWEPTLDDFMAHGFMGKPIEPIIKDSYVTSVLC